MAPIYDFTQERLRKELVAFGFPGYAAKQIFGWLYRKNAKNFQDMTSLSAPQRKILSGKFYFPRLTLEKKEKSSDATEKYLFKLEDGLAVETVFIPESRRNTLCVSTQVGCKFKCLFCASGQGGFQRNLTASEIINQYLSVAELTAPHKITNIVFMGIGEPLDNFGNLVKSIEILTDPEGISFSRRKISVSTCGLVPQIKKLAQLDLGIKLSVSLHSVDEAVRSRLVPVNKKYPLKNLLPVVREFSKMSRYRPVFEWVLLEGLNTDKASARKLAKLLNRLNAKANLIPYNGTFARFRVPGPETIGEFTAELKQQGAFFTLRKPRGADINAACGQLKALREKVTRNQ